MKQQSRQPGPVETDCERTRRCAQEYLDGELEETLTEQIRVHIDVCLSCGRRLVFESAFRRTISRCQKGGSAPSVVEERCQSLLTEWRERSS